MKKTVILLVVLSLLVAGCIGGKTEEKTTTSVKEMTTQTTVEADVEMQAEDVDVPFIDENDTVEIGDML